MPRGAGLAALRLCLEKKPKRIGCRRLRGGDLVRGNHLRKKSSGLQPAVGQGALEMARGSRRPVFKNASCLARSGAWGGQ